MTVVARSRIAALPAGNFFSDGAKQHATALVKGATNG